MLEELVNNAVYRACREVYEDAPKIRIKGKEYPPDPLEGFYYNAGYHTRFDFLPGVDGRSGLWKKGSLFRKAWLYFNDNGDKIFLGYVRDRFDGDLKAGMIQMTNYNSLRDDYIKYFGERRRKHLEQEQKALEAAGAALSVRKRTPQSHGGVANLLKVLTKTMTEQGSSIQTIAKVQYAVCIQAGIALPTDFLTDVIVAEEIINEEWGHQEDKI